MFVPHSLKKMEQTIIDELNSANIHVNFAITNFRQETRTVEYTLTNKSGHKDTLGAAEEIVKKRIEEWKTIFTSAKDSPYF